MPQEFSDDSDLNQQQEYRSDNQELPFLSINFVQQVDELVSLAHYGPSIVLIMGEDGIGKTCTLEQLENETSEIGQIRIDGNPMLSIDQLHASFLQQLNNYEQTVEYNSVRDSLLRASEISEQLILVDDAQQLSTSVLESLISLVSPIEQSPEVPVRLFLFGNEDLKRQMKMESFPQTAVYCMELKGFEKEEIPSFLAHQLNLSDDEVDESFDNKSLSHIWKNSHGNPGSIIRSLVNDDIDLEDVEEINHSPVPAIIFRSLLGLLGIALLVLALFGEKWFGKSWLKGETKEQPREAIEVNLNPQQDSDKMDKVEAKPEPKQSPISQNLPISEKTLQSASAEEETKQTQINDENSADDQNSLIENSSDINAVTIEKTEDGNTQASKPVAESTLSSEASDAANLKTEPEAAEVKPELPVAEKSPQLIAKEQPISANDFSANEKYLLEQPKIHYSIQLVGLSDFQEINKFAQQLSVNQPFYIYRSLLNGKPWYILVIGNYSDADTARAAKDNLQKSLKVLNPWIKSYRVIQKEINMAAKSRQ